VWEPVFGDMTVGKKGTKAEATQQLAQTGKGGYVRKV
jgi:hypothetical protein